MRTVTDRKSLSLVLGLAVLLSGCGNPDQIRRYQVKSEPSSAKSGLNLAAPSANPSASGGQRSLGAIVLHEGKAWFLKAMGPPAEISPIINGFDQVIRSLQFVEGEPKFELPSGWTRTPGSQFRFATLKTGAADVAVSSLPLRPGENAEQYTLANVNRWLGQVGKPGLSADQLGSVTKKVPISSGEAIVFDSGAPLSGVPASGGNTPSSSQETTTGATTPAGGNANQADGLTFDLPEKWQRGGNRPMRVATFNVDEDGKQLEITLTRLGVNSGSMLANVNRWRGQIGLEPIDQATLDKDTLSLDVAGENAPYFVLADAKVEKAIYVVVVERPDHKLFIKLMGDRGLAESEKSAFQEFVESIRFN